MGDKIKKLLVLFGVLFTLLTGGAGGAGVLQMVLTPTRQADPTAFMYVAKMFGLFAAGGIGTLFYQFAGHTLAAKVAEFIGKWWRGADLDPRLGDLLEIQLIEGLQQRRLSDPAYHQLVNNLEDYCRANPTAPPDLAPAVRAARKLKAAG